MELLAMIKKDSLELVREMIGPLPIIEIYFEKIEIKKQFSKFISNERYIDSILGLVKNILIEGGSLYSVHQWASRYDQNLINSDSMMDHVLARAIDNLFKIDRSSLMTKIVLKSMKEFNISMDIIHNDSTSIKTYGEYKNQNKKATQLKLGHSKDHRPDLKQIIYNLCITSDGAIPMYFKDYDGNTADVTTHWETWKSVQGILHRSDFLYIADSKLCSNDVMDRIDRNSGKFITVVPKNRKEVKDFAEKSYLSEIRWMEIQRKKVPRYTDRFDVISIAEGLFQLDQGYRVLWYRSSEKRRRDKEQRDVKMELARNKLSELKNFNSLNKEKKNSKSIKSFKKRVELIISKYGVSQWISYSIHEEKVEEFKKIDKGRPNDESVYRRIIKKIPKLVFHDNHDALAKVSAMDGIFPLVTNTNFEAKNVLAHYKGQMFLEKRHNLLKTGLQVAPVYLKKNDRIEGLMFIYFISQLVSSLIERDLRNQMKLLEIKNIPLLPEDRPTNTPTWVQIKRVFEHCMKETAYYDRIPVKCFKEEITDIQRTVLKLLNISEDKFK